MNRYFLSFFHFIIISHKFVCYVVTIMMQFAESITVLSKSAVFARPVIKNIPFSKFLLVFPMQLIIIK